MGDVELELQASLQVRGIPAQATFAASADGARVAQVDVVERSSKTNRSDEES